MANQVQCPNCGAYKINAEIENVPRPEKKLSYFFWLLAIFFVIAGCLLSLLLFVKVSVLPAAVVFGITLIWWLVSLKGLDRTTFKQYNFECELCGYKWTWKEGDPWPEVTVRSDLIAKGYQRLQEQEQQEHQRQAAALAAILEQQKRQGKSRPTCHSAYARS